MLKWYKSQVIRPSVNLDQPSPPEAYGTGVFIYKIRLYNLSKLHVHASKTVDETINGLNPMLHANLKPSGVTIRESMKHGIWTDGLCIDDWSVIMNS